MKKVVRNNAREAEMQAIAREVANLNGSPLYEFRKEKDYLPVIGEGSLRATIVVIGEAPGEEEAKSGKPFQGRSGKRLDEGLEILGVTRPEIFITNIVKDRPRRNRNPRPDEIALYAPFLDRQIVTIKPKVIVTLGQFSTDYIMKRYKVGVADKITNIHGQAFLANLGYGDVLFVPFFHPAYTLYNSSKKELFFRDFSNLRKLVK